MEVSRAGYQAPEREGEGSGPVVSGRAAAGGPGARWARPDALKRLLLPRVGLAVPLCIILMILQLSCAGSRFDGQTYRGSEFSFRLGPVPATARQIETDEALVAFRDDQAGSTQAISGRCGKDGDDVPLTALVQHLFIRFTQRQILSQREFRLAGRAALEVELTATLDGVPSHFVVVVLKRDGCVYDFLYMDGGGADPRTVQSRQDFRTMVQGFSVLD